MTSMIAVNKSTRFISTPARCSATAEARRTPRRTRQAAAGPVIGRSDSHRYTLAGATEGLRVRLTALESGLYALGARLWALGFRLWLWLRPSLAALEIERLQPAGQLWRHKTAKVLFFCTAVEKAGAHKCNQVADLGLAQLHATTKLRIQAREDRADRPLRANSEIGGNTGVSR